MSKDISTDELKKTVHTLEEALHFAEQVHSNEVQFKIARADLITSAETWLDFIEARNSSSHSYDDETAQKVFKQILLFRTDVQNLIKKLDQLT